MRRATFLRRKCARRSGKSIACDPESNLQKALLHSLADGLKPVDEKGRWKPSPLLVLLFLLLFALIGVFLYFSIGVRL